MANEKKKTAAPQAEGQTCKIASCKRPYRAKGLCITHYKLWRRGELEGHTGRYKTCSREGCRKKRELGGLCGEHAGKGTAEAPAT